MAVPTILVQEGGYDIVTLGSCVVNLLLPFAARQMKVKIDQTLFPSTKHGNNRTLIAQSQNRTEPKWSELATDNARDADEDPLKRKKQKILCGPRH